MEKCGEMEGLAGMIAGRTPSYFVYNSKYGPLASSYDVISYPNGSERCGSKLGFFTIRDTRLFSSEHRKAILKKTEEIVRDKEMCMRELPVLISRMNFAVYGEFSGWRI